LPSLPRSKFLGGLRSLNRDVGGQLRGGLLEVFSQLQLLLLSFFQVRQILRVIFQAECIDNLGGVFHFPFQFGPFLLLNFENLVFRKSLVLVLHR